MTLCLLSSTSDCAPAALSLVWRVTQPALPSQPEVEVLDETYLDRFRELTTEEQWEQQGFAVEVEEREE